jgi:hypothetical protein
VLNWTIEVVAGIVARGLAGRCGCPLIGWSALPVLALEVTGQVGELPWHAVEAELLQNPYQMIGESLALDEDGQEGSATGVHEGSLPDEPAIDVVQEERRPRGHVHEAPPLWREMRLASQGPDQLRSEGQSRATASRSAVNRSETRELHPDHWGRQAMARPGSQGVHDGSAIVTVWLNILITLTEIVAL